MSKIRVVLVEDHDLTRVGLRIGLQQENEVEVVGEASHGIRGLKLLEETQPDLVIIDLGLPGMDGVELIRRIKKAQAQGERLKTKVLVLTLQDNDEVVLAAFAAGADSYCVKNIQLDRLLEALRVTHTGNSWIDPAIAQVVLRQARQTQSKANLAAAEAETIQIDALESEYSQIIQASPLTERELEVLELIVEGHKNEAIAKKLYITIGTVKTHVRNLLNKLCADDRTQAAVRALRCGIIG